MSIFNFIAVWKAKQLLKKPCTPEAWKHATVFTLNAVTNIHPSWMQQALVMDSSYSKHLLTTAPMSMIYPLLEANLESIQDLDTLKFITLRLEPACVSIPVWTELCKTNKQSKDLAVQLYKYPNFERNIILAQQYIDTSGSWRKILQRKTLNKSFALLIETAVQNKGIIPNEDWFKKVYPSIIQPVPESLFENKQAQYRYQILSECPNALIHMAYHGDTIGLDQHVWPLTNPKALQHYIDALYVLTTYYPNKATQLLERIQWTGAHRGQPSSEINVTCMLHDNVNDAYAAWINMKVNIAMNVTPLPTDLFDVST